LEVGNRLSWNIDYKQVSQNPVLLIPFKFTFTQYRGRYRPGMRGIYGLRSMKNLIHAQLLRCYIVWGRRWKIIIVPLVWYLAVHGKSVYSKSETLVQSKAIHPATAFILVFGRNLKIAFFIPTVVAGAVAVNDFLLSLMIGKRKIHIHQRLH
jgi:hypothetical protein